MYVIYTLTVSMFNLKKTLSISIYIYMYLENVIKIVECQIVDHRQQGLPTLPGIPRQNFQRKMPVETRIQLHVYKY